MRARKTVVFLCALSEAGGPSDRERSAAARRPPLPVYRGLAPTYTSTSLLLKKSSHGIAVAASSEAIIRFRFLLHFRL